MTEVFFQERPSPTTAWLKGRDPQYGFGGWNLYADGYKIAADELVAGLGKDPSKAWQPEFLVYPICHLYHHHLELNLKRIWQRVNDYPKHATKTMKTHRLMVLWPQVRSSVTAWYRQPLDSVEAKLDQIEELLKTLDELDPRDEMFRYPTDDSGELHPLEDQLNFNLDALRDNVNEVSELLKPFT